MSLPNILPDPPSMMPDFVAMVTTLDQEGRSSLEVPDYCEQTFTSATGELFPDDLRARAGIPPAFSQQPTDAAFLPPQPPAHWPADDIHPISRDPLLHATHATPAAAVPPSTRPARIYRTRGAMRSDQPQHSERPGAPAHATALHTTAQGRVAKHARVHRSTDQITRPPPARRGRPPSESTVYVDVLDFSGGPSANHSDILPENTTRGRPSNTAIANPISDTIASLDERLLHETPLQNGMPFAPGSFAHANAVPVNAPRKPTRVRSFAGQLVPQDGLQGITASMATGSDLEIGGPGGRLMTGVGDQDDVINPMGVLRAGSSSRGRGARSVRGRIQGMHGAPTDIPSAGTVTPSLQVIDGRKIDFNNLDTFGFLRMIGIRADGMMHAGTEICRFCRALYGSEESRLRHEKQAHKPGENPFECQECGMVCKSVTNIRRHMKTCHTPSEGAEEVLCPACEARFYSGRCMKAHLKLKHADEVDSEGKRYVKKPKTNRKSEECCYGCKFCAASYKEKNNLVRHVSTKHLHLYPFPCTICTQCCSTKNNLRVHMESHRKERGRFARHDPGT